MRRSERATGTSFWSRAWQNHAPGYLFLLPWFIGFFGLTIGPILTSLYLSFTDFDLLTPANWIGTDNYVRMFTNDRKFVGLDAGDVVLRPLLGAAEARLRARRRDAAQPRHARACRSTARCSTCRRCSARRSPSPSCGAQLFAKDGLVNDFLSIFGIMGPSWISNPNYSLWTLVILSVWQFGSPMIIFLAGLRQIPQDMYEAASLDGASKWRQFWKITLPLLTPVVFFNAIIQTIEAFKSFTPAFIISGGTGGPINSTLFYTLYLYQEAFAFFRMGYASALAWFLLVIIACFTAFSFLTSQVLGAL